VKQILSVRAALQKTLIDAPRGRWVSFTAVIRGNSQAVRVCVCVCVWSRADADDITVEKAPSRVRRAPDIRPAT